MWLFLVEHMARNFERQRFGKGVPRDDSPQPDAFARRLLIAMAAVAREAGLASAYPPTDAGQLAALQAQLRTVESSREWGSDFQRSLVLRAIRRLREAHHAGDHTAPSWRCG